MNEQTERDVITPEEHETFARTGFKYSFGTWTRSTDLHVCIVWNPEGARSKQFGVYVFHGHPGGAFWRSDRPLVRTSSIEEARSIAETLYGIYGSGKLATLITLDRRTR